ncbi:MAG TPA: substrate-binding domain-containing protein, partial [Nakamurella sp.]
IGIDDHPLASLTDLTTIRQEVFEQGARSARILLELLQGNTEVNQAVVLPTHLVVRHSTAPPEDPKTLKGVSSHTSP